MKSMQSVADKYKTHMDGFARDEGDVAQTVRVSVACCYTGCCRKEGDRYTYHRNLMKHVSHAVRKQVGVGKKLEDIQIAFRELEYLFGFFVEDTSVETTDFYFALASDAFGAGIDGVKMAGESYLSLQHMCDGEFFDMPFKNIKMRFARHQYVDYSTMQHGKRFTVDATTGQRKQN